MMRLLIRWQWLLVRRQIINRHACWYVHVTAILSFTISNLFGCFAARTYVTATAMYGLLKTRNLCSPFLLDAHTFATYF